MGVGIVKPEQVDLPVIRNQLLHLSVHVGQIAVKVDFFILEGGVIPHGMVHIAVFGEIRVMPVDEGIVQPYPQSLGSDSLHKFPYQIPSAERAGAFVVRPFGIEQAEAVVVLGGQHYVLHPRRLY